MTTDRTSRIKSAAWECVVAALLLSVATVAFADQAERGIPISQVEYSYTIALTGPGIWDHGSGTVRSGFRIPVALALSNHRLEMRIDRTGASEYSAEIRLYRSEGENWREATIDPLTHTGRFGEYASSNFEIGDISLEIAMNASPVVIRAFEAVAPDFTPYVLLAALSILAAAGLIVLYRFGKRDPR